MPVKIKMIDQKGKAGQEVSLSEKVFDAPVKKHLLFDVVKMQLAGRRQGTANTKSRGLVRGGGVKPHRQKGTGFARQGSIRSPLNRGGGTVFGPTTRDYTQDVPKKVRLHALKSALSSKQKDGKLHVVKEFTFEKPKTKEMQTLFDGLKVKKALVVDVDNENLKKSVRNLRSSKYVSTEGLNVFDIMKYDHLFLTSASIKKIEERLGQS